MISYLASCTDQPETLGQDIAVGVMMVCIFLGLPSVLCYAAYKFEKLKKK